MLAGSVLGAILGLGYLLWRPFWHPNTYLTYWTGGRYYPAELAPLDFTYEDFAGMAALEPALARPADDRPVRLITLSSPAAVRDRLRELLGTIQAPRSTLLLYFQSHVEVREGLPYLVCAESTSTASSPATLPLDEVFSIIAESAATTKLVCLDYRDRAEFVPGVPSFSAFPAAVESRLQSLGDPSVWVLLSHDWNEIPRTSWAVRQSVFAHVLSRALQGAADVDGNRVIDLAEMYDYVRLQVPLWNLHVFGAAAAQSPRLLWFGPPGRSTRYPELLATGSIRDSVHRRSMSELVAAAQAPIEETGVLLEIKGHIQENVEDVYEDFTLKLLGGKRYNPRFERARMVGQPLGSRLRGPPGGAEPAAAGDVVQGEPTEPGAEGAPPGGPAAESAADGGADWTGPAPDEGVDESTDLSPERQAQLAAARRAEFEQVLADGWAARDRLYQAAAGTRLLETAPAAWGVLDATLLWYNRLQRSGALGSDHWQYLPLRGLVASLQRLADNRLELRARPRDVAQRLFAAKPTPPFGPEGMHSLGMAAAVSRWRGVPMEAAFADLVVQFDSAIGGPSRSGLDEFLTKMPAGELSRYVELASVRHLAEKECPWPLLTLAARIRRGAERLAADEFLAQGWLLDAFRALEERRAAAEARLPDVAHSQNEASMERELRSLLAAYAAIEADLALIRRAYSARCELLYHASGLVAIWSAAGDAHAPVNLRFEDLIDFLELLQSLSLALESPRGTDIATLRPVWPRFLAAWGRIETSLGLDDAEWANSAWNADHLATLRSLADTTLLPGSDRVSLQLETTAAEAARTARFEFVPVERRQLESMDRAERQEITLQRRLLLNLALAQLASAGEPTWLGRVDALRDSALDLISRTRHQSVRELLSEPEAWLAIQRDLVAWRGGLRDHIATTLRQWQTLPLGPQRRERTKWLRFADRAIRVLRLPELGANEMSASALLAYASWFDTLDLGRERIRSMLDQQGIGEAGALELAATLYRDLAERLPRQPRLELDREPLLVVEGVGNVYLPHEGGGQASLEITWRGVGECPLWLVLDYDRASIRVQTAEGVPFHMMDSLAKLAGEGSPSASRSESQLFDRARAAGPPTLRLAPHQSRKLTLEISSDSHGWSERGIGVWLVTKEATLRRRLNVRAGTPQPLRLVAAHAGEWQSIPDGIVLHPLPNRPATAQLQIATDLSQEREIRAQLWAPAAPLKGPLPVVPLAAAGFQELFDSLRPLTPLGPPTTVKVRAGTPGTLTFPPPMEAVGAPPQGGSTPPQGPADGALAAATIPASLLITLADLSTGDQYVRRIEVAPQRPRRYVRCRAGYNSSNERIEIEVRPLANEAVPDGGIRVACQFVEPIPFPGESRLEAMIAPPDYVARLFAAVPLRAGYVATAQVRVDDYPRAFVFQIPCQAAAGDVAERYDRADLRILKPTPGSAFLPSAEGIEVALQVDAPMGAFEGNPPADFVELGLDIDRDRELAGEPTVRLQSDRQVDVVVTSMAADGTIAFVPRVRDFTLRIPTAGIEDVRLNVLGRLQAGGRAFWSAPVEIVLGGTGPRVERLELAPGREVVIGQEADVSAWFQNRGLANLAKVEVAWDLDRDGKLTDADQPESAQLVAGTRWNVKLKTDTLTSGHQSLLVRGTDILGTAGPVAIEDVIAFTPQQLASRSNPLSGRVRYGQWAVPNARVSLERDGRVVMGPIFTDSDGAFAFPQVPIGEYDLTARGLAKNRPRTGSVRVSVKAPPSGAVMMEVQVR